MFCYSKLILKGPLFLEVYLRRDPLILALKKLYKFYAQIAFIVVQEVLPLLPIPRQNI